MSMCQTITALSAKIEAARGVVSGLFEHAFFYIQTWSASRLNWKAGFSSVSIFSNSLISFFTSDIRCNAADSIFIDVDEDHGRWWVSSRWDRSLGRVTFHCVLQQKLIWTLQNLGFGVVMSRICRTVSQIGPSSILISMLSVLAIMSIIISVTIKTNNIHFLWVWICNNSLLNFFISEVRRGYQRVGWPHCQGCR